MTQSAYNKLKMAAVDQGLFLIQEVIITLKRCESILAIIGLFYVGKTAAVVGLKLLEGIRVHILSHLRWQDFRKYGEWAVVTGGTDGIGKQYARELARRGLNIILVSRNMDKLKTTAQELEDEFRVRTCVIQADLSKGREIYNDIGRQLQGKEIGILVNNAGVMYDSPSLFLNVPEQKLVESVNINMMAVMMMTYLILPQMVQRKKGIVVNVSSISAFYPLPLMAVYSASKVFVDWFSMALDYEYKDKGIIVQSLIPSYISTKLVRFSNFLSTPSIVVPDAETFVRSSLHTIGVSKRTTGFWSHGLQYWMYEHVPQWAWNLTSWMMFKVIDNTPKPKSH
ncbi:inactive hydroxysteroid dehydrogenase-like protein 1 [Ornithodoros turicata]